MLEGLRTTIYAVADLTTAKNWYTTLIGHTPYFDEPFYVGFNVGGYELGLIPEEGDDATTYWGTANIDAEVARVIGLGGTLASAIRDVGDGVRVATIKDPFGNRIGLIENTHFNAAA